MRLLLSASAAFVSLSILLTGCDIPSDNLPPQAVAADTVGVMKLSFAGLGYEDVASSIETLAAMGQKSSVPQVVQGAGLLGLAAMQLDPEYNSASKAFFDGRDAMLAAGIRSMCILIPERAANAIDFRYLLQGSETSSLTSATTALAAAEFKDANDEAPKLIDLGGKWYLVGVGNTALPTAPQAQLAGQLDAALQSLPGSAVTFGFVLSPEARANFLDAAGEVNPLAGAMLMGFQQPMQSLTHGAASMDLGPNPTFRARGTFSDAANAKDFCDTWDQTLKGLAAFALQAAPKNGPQETMAMIERMLGALQFKQDGSSARLTLDAAAWATLLK